MYPQQRGAHRYRFIASAEAALGSEVRPARVELLSIAGAYLAMPNPFPKGASIQIKIRTNTEFFECKATAAYSTPGAGMGVMFSDVGPPFRVVLREWLFKATK